MLFKYLIVFFVSMIPILELRFAVPFAVGMDLPYVPALITCVLGNIVPVPFVYVFGRSILHWGSHKKYIGTLCGKILNLADDEHCLTHFVECAIGNDLAAAAVVRPEVFAFARGVVADKLVCRIEDILR